MADAAAEAAANAAALTAALNNIAQALVAIQANQANANQAAPPAAPAAAGGHVPVLDLFDDATPFDMASRAGFAAMTEASAPLATKWDGSVTKFPAFLSSLKQRAHKVKWDAPAPNGILVYTQGATDYNLIDSYHTVTEATINTAHAVRVDNRARQNSMALFRCLSTSLEGDLKTVFDQAHNMPDNQDGPLLFKQITDMTVASSTMLSIQAIDQLQNLEPSDLAYNISLINEKLNQLFTLATTNSRTVSDPERVQYVLRCYGKIMQPAAWQTWVEHKTASLEDGTLPGTPPAQYLRLMNDGILKAGRLINDHKGPWKSTSITDDVVAMMAAAKKNTPRTTGDSKSTSSDASGGKSKFPIPPFAHHFKSSGAPDAVKYKFGDTKEHKGHMYHFCECPTHRDRIKWHPFPAVECKSCIKWLESRGANRNPAPAANVGEVPDDAIPAPAPANDDVSVASTVSNLTAVTSALATALASASDDATRDLNAEALSA